MKALAVVALSILTALAASAQSITTIYSFANGNGMGPYANLTLGPDGNFYGTTANDGSNGYGTAFKVTTNGILTTLLNFNGTNGASPEAGLTLGPDGNFYGTTQGGGSDGYGTVFKMTTTGVLTTLANFNNTNGANPTASLTLGPGGDFYGTTEFGGSGDLGTVFRVTTNGTLTTLVIFNNTNGSNPRANLTLGPDGNFYGTTYPYFYATGGTVFKVTTNGELTTLVNFNGTNGADPWTGVTLGPDGNFYGTTSQGGITYSNGMGSYGTVFKVTTNGALTTLFEFNGTNGISPQANLILGPDGNFYGTTFGGGSYYSSPLGGTVFQITTNGTFTTLASFDGTNGQNPMGNLILGPDNNFYGTTPQSDNFDFGGGIMYRLNLPPTIIANPANQSIVIGGKASFNFQLFGSAPFAYQWLSNGVPIIGATNATLSISPALPSQIGNYQLVVTNAFGSITSQIASLNVLLQPNVCAISSSGAGFFKVSLASVPNTTNRLWATTNFVLGPWQVIATNITDSNGLAQFLDTNTVGTPQKFYRLSYP